jgi:hypothetical protein
MAAARCERCGPIQGTRVEYSHAHLPELGTIIICGARTCILPATIWLTAAEQEDYNQGLRDFHVWQRVGKIRLS